MPMRYAFLLAAVLVGACSADPSVPPATASATATPPAIAEPTVTAQPPTPKPSVTPAAGPTAPAAAGWTETFERDGARLAAAHVVADGFVAGGCTVDGAGTCLQALLVASRDGASWHEVTLPSPDAAWIDTFAKIDDRHFAIGARVDEVRFVIEPMVWTSIDGASWTSVSIPGSTNTAVQDIVASPSGAVAIGIHAPYASEGSGFISWSVGKDGSFGQPREVAVPQAFAFVGGASWVGSRFLAWGDVWSTLDDEDGTPISSTVLFESPDGMTWSKLPQPDELANDTISDIIVRGGRLVAVGYEGTQLPVHPRAWTSADGRHWRRADGPTGDGSLYGMVVEGSSLVAFGRVDAGELTSPAAWRSTDGRTWSRVDDNELQPAISGFWPPAPVSIGARRCVAGSFGMLDANVVSIRAAIYCR